MPSFGCEVEFGEDQDAFGPERSSTLECRMDGLSGRRSAQWGCVVLVASAQAIDSSRSLLWTWT
jgi:hypothetical protein